MEKNKTNKEFARTDEEFKAACDRTQTNPTTRQASKWRNCKGKAWKNRRKCSNANSTN